MLLLPESLVILCALHLLKRRIKYSYEAHELNFNNACCAK